MKRLIRMKPWKQKLKMVVHIMMLHFQVNILFKIKKRTFIRTFDHQKIPNIKNLDSDYMNMAYDPQIPIQYPIFWNGRYSIQ